MPSFPTYSVRLADHPAWRHDTAYSRHVGILLSAAFTAIHHGAQDAAAFRDALTLLRPYLDAPMSRHQRLRVYYLAALARAALGEQAAALFWVDESLNLASQVPDSGDLADVYYLRGSINRALLRLQDAIADYWTCLALLDEEGDTQGRQRPGFALTIRSLLAGFHFFRGHYALAQQLVRQASLLLPSPLAHSLDGATLAWTQALLDRWRGEPARAIQHALYAADRYTRLGSPASAARIQTVVADIRLDLAERLPPGSERERTFDQTWPHVRLALKLASEAGDRAGYGPAELVRLRYLRLRGTDRGRAPAIEQVVRLGEQLGDEALVAQGLTSLGDELLAGERTDAALACYREVLDLLEQSDVPAMGRWARRALRLEEEMRS